MMAGKCVVLVLGLAAALCAAAPRVEIKVVPRPRPDPATSGVTGPIPFRDPAAPTGPFSTYSETIGCVSNTNLELDGHSVMIDVCHLKNVTLVELSAAVSTEAQRTEEASAATTEGSGSSENQEQPQAAPVPVRKILGIFRGWKLDPIYKKFKYAVFDDGDLCEYGQRYSVDVELVRSAQSDFTSRVYDLQKLSTCSYKVRVEVFVPEYELMASSGIQTPGVVEISDAEEMLPQICGEMKCQYTHVSTKTHEVKLEIENIKKSLEELVTADATSVSALTLTAASSIIKSSTDIMEKALEMLETIEKVDQSAQALRDAAAKSAPITVVEEVQATS